MNSDEIRTAFLKFFEEKGHKVIPSSSLIPKDNPTLLLTTAGVVQVQPYILGQAVPPSKRLASCQKCFRTTDIESVGDATHMTFFEMLGNWSVGDYFKKEAAAWAWEFVTVRLRLPSDKLWITIYLDDDEAFKIWRAIGIPENRIVRCGEKDNFWGPPGSSGPCGPCSEIHFDLGEERSCGSECKPNDGCGRFVEIWNLVFMQYFQDDQGKRSPLAHPCVDTGMGLERTLTAINGKKSAYDTDVFAPLLNRVSELTGKQYGVDSDDDNAMRIVAEHGRSLAFLIADGVLPDNDGRGYVLRRLLRRAALFGRRLGLEKPFLSEIAKAAIKKMGHIYPELVQRQDFIVKVIEMEEARFEETLNTGLEIINELTEYRKNHKDAIPEVLSFLNESKPSSENAAKILEQYGFIGETLAAEVISQLVFNYLKSYEQEGKFNKRILSAIKNWGNNISGDELFKLYDTFGFPIELTKEIMSRSGYTVDMAGFEKEMEKQRERARATHKFDVAAKMGGVAKLDVKATQFTGYTCYEQKAMAIKILVDGVEADKISKNQKAAIILDITPFYGEMGGQVGDTGTISGAKGKFNVTSTVHLTPEIILHQGEVAEGAIACGEIVKASVNIERRLDIARNHTATHLLQAALRQVLGGHIQQRGSLVAPERLRFDFSHLTAMTPDELKSVQRIVNEKIRQNLNVMAEEMGYKKAVESGATALFDEKYGDVVRVMRIGNPVVSAELCGGTHISSTGEIGFFQIIGQSSVGAGLRRIEAVTGRGAEAYLSERLANLENVAKALETTPEKLPEKVAALTEELKQGRKQALALEHDAARKGAEALLDKVTEIRGVKVLVARVTSNDQQVLREIADFLRDKLGSAIVVLGAAVNERPIFIATVTPDLIQKGYSAGNIIKEVSKVAGGGGGGKPNFAQAGGKDVSKLDEALALVKILIK